MSAAAAEPGAARSVQCPLCGGRFAGKESCPSGCPLSANCRTLCCPHCHYRFVEDSTVARWVRQLFPGRRP